MALALNLRVLIFPSFPNRFPIYLNTIDQNCAATFAPCAFTALIVLARLSDIYRGNYGVSEKIFTKASIPRTSLVTVPAIVSALFGV
jgi:hypothetical protein